MAWPRRGDFGPRDLLVISLCSLCSLADCRAPQALAGAIKADGISPRLIPRPKTKIAHDLSSRELLLSLSDPLNLPMRHDWVAVHVEHLAPLAGGKIDSAVSRGRVICEL